MQTGVVDAMEIRRLERVEDQFSRIVVHGQTAYFAGLVADSPEQDIAGQCRQVLEKLDELLQTVGSGRDKLLTMTVYLKDFDDYPRFKTVFADWADANNLPARATVRADLRDPGMRIEIMAIAALVRDGTNRSLE